MQILQIISIFILPYFLVRISKGLKIEKILSPVVLCYAIGLVFKNFIAPDFISKETTDIITQGTIALAIPLVLMNADFKAFIQGGKEIIISFFLAIISVTITCIVASFLFQNQTEATPEIAGMLAGVYTGGTPNMAAIQAAIQADENLYGALNIADITMGGIYLVFLTSIGPSIFRFLLGNKKEKIEIQEEEIQSINNNKNSSPILKSISVALGLAVLCAATSIGVSILFYGKINDSFFIIGITLLGIGISFFPWSKKLEYAYPTGDYLLLAFSLALGLMSSFHDILDASIVVIYFTAVVMFGAIFLHLLLSRIFRISADATLITSAACIFGPVFIGQIVSVMGNKKMLVPGMAMGVLGIALGSLLGILIYEITSLL